MKDTAGEPGILTLLEAARRDPSLHKLTLSAEFIDNISTKYFADASKDDPSFHDDLWNMLEGANALYKRVNVNGVTSAEYASAQQVLRTVKQVLDSAGALTPADFEKLGLALITMLRSFEDTSPLELLDKERVIEELHDGNRVRQLVTEAIKLIDGCLQFTPPDTLPERRSWAIRAWCICVMKFWVNRAHLEPTLTKLSERGGVRIKSPIGKFSEECLSEIGVKAAYDLRSALTFARKQIANDALLKKLLLDGDTVRAVEFLANWKDRFPFAVPFDSVLPD